MYPTTRTRAIATATIAILTFVIWLADFFSPGDWLPMRQFLYSVQALLGFSIAWDVIDERVSK